MLYFVIKDIRLKKKMSLYELSKRSGVSKTYLADLENNKKSNPSFFTMVRISEALKVKMEKLFYETDDIEKLKQKMYKSMEQYGINAKETLEISHLIDELVNLNMREQLKKRN